MLIRRGGVVPVLPGQYVLPAPPACLEKCPTLWEFLAREFWEDGSIRHRGSLRLFTDGNELRVMFQDNDAKKMRFCTAERQQNLLAALEKWISEEGGDWRQMKEWDKGKK